MCDLLRHSFQYRWELGILVRDITRGCLVCACGWMVVVKTVLREQPHGMCVVRVEIMTYLGSTSNLVFRGITLLSTSLLIAVCNNEAVFTRLHSGLDIKKLVSR